MVRLTHAFITRLTTGCLFSFSCSSDSLRLSLCFHYRCFDEARPEWITAATHSGDTQDAGSSSSQVRIKIDSEYALPHSDTASCLPVPTCERRSS